MSPLTVYDNTSWYCYRSQDGKCMLVINNTDAHVTFVVANNGFGDNPPYTRLRFTDNNGRVMQVVTGLWESPVFSEVHRNITPMAYVDDRKCQGCYWHLSNRVSSLRFAGVFLAICDVLGITGKQLYHGNDTNRSNSSSSSSDDDGMIVIRKKVQKKVVQSEPAVVGNDLTCACHGRLFSRPSTLRRHLHPPPKTSHPCLQPGCSWTFRFKFNLNDHMAATHDKSKKFLCSLCQNRFARSSSLNSHVRKVHGNKKRKR